MMTANQGIDKIRNEYERAIKKFGPFKNSHEGYAVILEEVDELWEEVKSKDGLGRAKEEAIQVAAMALRFLSDLPD